MPVRVVGVHRLRTGDAAGSVAELLAGEKARIFYTDPPWGPGMMKYFQTLADKAAGRTTPSPVRDYLELLRDLATQAAEHTTGPVFIEYGQRWRGDVIETGRLAGLTPITVIPAIYSGGRPYDIHAFAPKAATVDLSVIRTAAYQSAVSAAHGTKRGLLLLGPFAVPDGIIVDPCCGLGWMLKLAQRLGMRFYGNELNAARLARSAAAAQ